MRDLDEILAGYDPSIDWVADPEQRRTFLGASDAAAVMGLNPRQSPIDVWLTKTGQHPDPFGGNEHTERGHRFEPVIADWVDEDHPEWDVINPDGRTWRHPDHPCIAATPDRFLSPTQLFEDRPGIGVLEVKTADWRLRDRWEGDAPDEYIVQILVQMMVTGCRWGVLACMVDWDKKEYVVDWDPDLAAVIRDRMIEFWGHIEDRVPPSVVGHPDEYRDLAMVWPGDPEAAAEVSSSLIAELAELRRQKEVIEQRASILKGHVVEELKDATAATVDGEKVAIWVPRTELDLDRLRAEHPDAVADCTTPAFDAKSFRKTHPMLAKTHRRQVGRTFRLTDKANDVA